MDLEKEGELTEDVEDAARQDRQAKVDADNIYICLRRLVW